MQIQSVIFLVLITFAVVALAVLLVTAIYTNFKSGLHVRSNLHDRIRLIRFKSMLLNSGVDINTFLYSQPVSELENQIRKCESCENIDACEAEISGNNFDDPQLAYCPNNEVIIKFRNMTTAN